MNGYDLWLGLGGEAPDDRWVSEGRPVAKIVSGCGSRLGEIKQTGGGLKVLVDGFRLTKPHTASVIADQVLLDFEELLQSGSEDELLAEQLLGMAELLAPENEPRVPPLEVPPSRGSVTQLVDVVARTEREAVERGHKRNEVTNMTSVCKKCRRSLYLADAVVSWSNGGQRGRTIVTNDPPRLAKAQGFEFPGDALGMRASTYERLRALYA